MFHINNSIYSIYIYIYIYIYLFFCYINVCEDLLWVLDICETSNVQKV